MLHACDLREEEPRPEHLDHLLSSPSDPVLDSRRCVEAELNAEVI
jgi:hypothetical protein